MPSTDRRPGEGPCSHRPLPAILLAAGASRRLGRPKQLLPYRGEALAHRAARLALACCDPVLAVLGSEAEAVRAALADLPLLALRNLDWEEGMASSLRTGLVALPPDAPAVLLLVCDQPALERGHLEALLALHHAHPAAIVASAYAGRRGVPAILPRRCFPELLAIHGDQGARELLRGEGVLEVDFPGGEVDVDRPEDVEGMGRG